MGPVTDLYPLIIWCSALSAVPLLVVILIPRNESALPIPHIHENNYLTPPPRVCPPIQSILVDVARNKLTYRKCTYIDKLPGSQYVSVNVG